MLKTKMIDCLEITKYFIIKAYEDGREYEITNLKIQKLLYYSQSIYLALYDEPLFDDNLEAWRLGPVCPKAYKYYASFEGKQLDIPSKQELDIPSEIKKTLDDIWSYFGYYHAYCLSDMSHVELPWRKARAGFPSHVRSNNIIDLDELKVLGTEKLLEMERESIHSIEIISKILEKALLEKDSCKTIKKEEINDWLESI